MPTESEMRKSLATHLCEIQFTKRDGSFRKMIATLIPEILNEVFGPPSEEPRTQREGLLTVYEIGNGWRSIRVESIIEFRPMELESGA